MGAESLVLLLLLLLCIVEGALLGRRRTCGEERQAGTVENGGQRRLPHGRCKSQTAQVAG